jgi:uncharacterized protein DUF1629
LKPRPPAYWVWQPYSTERGVAFATEFEGLSGDVQRKVLLGEKLRRLPKITVTATTSGRFYDVLGAPVGILFVAPVLRRVLETPGIHAQFVPVSVRGQSKKVYYLTNVLDTISAIDLEKSSYDVFEGTDAISKIHRLRLRPIPADAPPVFHAAEDPPMTFVSEELHRRLTQASEHAGVFTSAEKFRNEY